MHPVIELQTRKFDVSSEKENPINPIYGQSLLLWLREKAKGTVEVVEPDFEDWGWSSDLERQGNRYMLGASCDGDETWIFQIDKNRTVLEKLLGRNRMTDAEEFWLYFVACLNRRASFMAFKFRNNLVLKHNHFFAF